MPFLRPCCAAVATAALSIAFATPAAVAADPAKPSGTVVQKSQFTVDSKGKVAGAPAVAPSPADELLRKANELRAKGDFPGALAKAREALKKVPDHPEALMLAGILEGATGQFDEALAHLAKAIAVLPTNMFARKAYADALMEKHRMAEALEALGPVLKVTPVDPQAYSMAAQIAASAKDYDQAQKYLDQALAVDPGYVPAHQVAIGIAIARKQPEEARKHFVTLTKAHPEDAEAWVRMAGLDIGLGRVEEAGAELEHARKAQPGQPGPWIASAELAMRQHQLDVAAGYVGKLEGVAPGSLPALSLRGQLLMAQGHPGEAVKPLQSALAKQPLPEVFLQLHEALLASNQQAEAERRMGLWLHDHPDDDTVRFIGAESAARHGAFPEAVTNFRKLLERHPDDLLALNDLAQSLQAQHDPQAQEIAEKAWKLQPDSPVTENTLGSILMANGKSDRGLDLLRQAASKAPSNPEVRFDYARALASTGDKAGAKTELEAVLNLKRPFPDEAAARAMLRSLSGG